MLLFVRQKFGRLTALLFFACVSLCSGQEPAAGQPDLASAYGLAMADFQAGNYAKAAGALEALVARVEVTPQVEPIFYTIGSAWFNAADYPKAIAAFKNYLAKFPNGPHAGEAAFAIAQSNLLSKNFKEAAAQMAALENDSRLRDQALLFEADAFKAAGKIDEAILALEKLTGRESGTRMRCAGRPCWPSSTRKRGRGRKLFAPSKRSTRRSPWPTTSSS